MRFHKPPSSTKFEKDLPFFGKTFAEIANRTVSFDLVRILKSGIYKALLEAEADYMMTDRLGKWLFPRWQTHRQRREIKTLLAAVAVGLFVAGIITAILILVNSIGH